MVHSMRDRKTPFYSTREAREVLAGENQLEFASEPVREHVRHVIRMKAIEICKMRTKQQRHDELDKCPTELRGYLESEVNRVWKIMIDNAKQ